MLNSSQNLSHVVTSPTDITSDQEGTINKNSIESGTEQSLQGSSAGNQNSLDNYVDADSTPVSEGINDTMQVADDNEVTSGNKGNRSVVSSDSTPLSEDSVNGQEDVTESKKEKGKRSASKRLQKKKVLVDNLKQQLKEKDEEITQLKTQLKASEEEKNKELEAEKNKAEQEKQNLEAEKNKAKAQITTLNTEVEKLKKELENKGSEIQKLGEKNKELEAKNKTTEQPKQGNGAKYTATVGMGLAAGLIAFTALERTVRLKMLVMIGIAVVSALVAGGITYAALPSTQVDGAKAQEVNENGKKK